MKIAIRLLILFFLIFGCNEGYYEGFDCISGECIQTENGSFKNLNTCIDYCNSYNNNSNNNSNNNNSNNNNSNNNNSNNNNNNPSNRWDCTSGLVSGNFESWCEYNSNGSFTDYDACVDYCASNSPDNCNCGIVTSTQWVQNGGWYVYVQNYCTGNNLTLIEQFVGLQNGDEYCQNNDW